MQIWLKRAYEKPGSNDGYRVLVDRVWPRGVKKEALELNDWLQEIAPSSELRKWFGHDPEKWDEFRQRYFKELDGRKEVVDSLLSRLQESRVTLVYGAGDEQHNQAVALKEYLEKKAPSASGGAGGC